MAQEAILKRIYGPAQPGTVTGILFTVAGSKRVTIKQIIVANTTASAATLTIGIGGTAAANLIIPTVSVPANTTVTFDLTQTLEAAETLNGLQGTSAALTVTITCVEESV